MNCTPFSRAENSSEPRQRDAVATAPGADEAARDVHLHGRERARALAVGDAGILGRDRAGLDVGLVAEHQEATAPRARDMPPPSCVPLMRAKRT